MRIGIIADTHDKETAVTRAVAVFRQNDVGIVIHCGDITTPEIVQLFSGFEFHAVLGNNDTANKAALAQAIRSLNAASDLHGLFAELTIDGIRIAVLHGVRESAIYDHARTADYEYVLHGHFHEAEDVVVAGTTVINPGAHRSVVVLDTVSKEHWFVSIDPEGSRLEDRNESDELGRGPRGDY